MALVLCAKAAQCVERLLGGDGHTLAARLVEAIVLEQQAAQLHILHGVGERQVQAPAQVHEIGGVLVDQVGVVAKSVRGHLPPFARVRGADADATCVERADERRAVGDRLDRPRGQRALDVQPALVGRASSRIVAHVVLGARARPRRGVACCIGFGRSVAAESSRLRRRRRRNRGGCALGIAGRRVADVQEVVERRGLYETQELEAREHLILVHVQLAALGQRSQLVIERTGRDERQRALDRMEGVEVLAGALVLGQLHVLQVELDDVLALRHVAARGLAGRVARGERLDLVARQHVAVLLVRQVQALVNCHEQATQRPYAREQREMRHCMGEERRFVFDK